MAADRFSMYLKSARERKGLTQSVLAGLCRLTGSYISLLESGRKPAPSDSVVRRLAAALDLPAEDALHVAHLDRAPEELRRAVDRLRTQAARERDLRERTAEALFPFSIWNLVPGTLSRRARAAVGPNLDVDIVEAIDRIADVARGAPDLPTLRKETRRILDSLPRDRRKRVLEVAPALVEDAAAPRLVPAPEPGLPPDVRPGDVLVVDSSLPPAAGDVVLAGAEGKPAVLRWTPGLAGVQGVVLEVRRKLR